MKAKQLIYINDWYRWANTLPGGPIIHVENSTEAGGVVVYYHRQHRRRMKYKYVNDARPAGVMIYFVEVSHKHLKKLKEVKPASSWSYGGYIAGDYYRGGWDWD